MTTPRPHSAQTRERAAIGVGGASPQWPQKLTNGTGSAPAVRYQAKQWTVGAQAGSSSA